VKIARTPENAGSSMTVALARRIGPESTVVSVRNTMRWVGPQCRADETCVESHMFRWRHKNAVRTDICRFLSRLISERIGKSASRMNFSKRIFYTYRSNLPTPTCVFDFGTRVPSLCPSQLTKNQVKAELYTHDNDRYSPSIVRRIFPRIMHAPVSLGPSEHRSVRDPRSRDARLRKTLLPSAPPLSLNFPGSSRSVNFPRKSGPWRA
jgi:hypothetical protein